MAVYEKVCKALNEKRKGDESLLDFSLRAAKKANSLDNDDDWKELGDNIQRWAVAVLTAKEAAGKDETPEIPGLDGWPGDETEAEAADEEATEEGDEEADDEAGDEEGEQDEDTASEEAAEESVDESADSAQEEASEAEPEEDAPAPKAKKKAGKVEKTPVKPQKSKEKSNGKGKDKEMTTTKAAKSTKTPASQNARTRIDPKGTIKVLAKKNPHRDGSKNFTSFSKYRDGMTVEAAIKAKIPPKNIYYEVKIGNIKVVPAKKSAAA